MRTAQRDSNCLQPMRPQPLRSRDSNIYSRHKAREFSPDSLPRLAVLAAPVQHLQTAEIGQSGAMLLSYISDENLQDWQIELPVTLVLVQRQPLYMFPYCEFTALIPRYKLYRNQ